MFDANSPFVLNVLPSQKGEQFLRVKFERYPNDAEWIAHQRARKVIDHQTGRGVETKVVGREDADAALIAAVAPAIDLTASQREMLVDRLARVSVEDIEADAAEFTLTVRFFAGVGTHTLSMPTAEHLRECDAATKSVPLGGGRVEYRTNLDVYRRVYDELRVNVADYAGEPPLLHKVVAVQGVISRVKEQLEGDAQPFL